jgi:PAS domain S-box-containing protein
MVNVMIGDTDDDRTEGIDSLLATPHLADALESDRFRHFLDQIPIAIVVSEMNGTERITYANPEFEKLSGQSATELQGKPWSALRGQSGPANAGQHDLGAAIVNSSDRVGTFAVERVGGEAVVVDVYSNVIEDESGTPAFRLAALVDVGVHEQAYHDELERRLNEKDMQLKEIQHRVKNNLQMITALIRIEARNAAGRIESTPFDRLAGRIDAIGLVYKLLSDQGKEEEVDLGVYLSTIASSVMQSHAVDGMRLDLKVDTYPVSVNVAMPTGLVVNELLMNALKHAFKGRNSGTITLHSLTDANGCRVVVGDDGVGLPEGVEWPKRDKLSALIVRSLRENARADLTVESGPGKGMRVTIVFTRASSAPKASE